MSGRRVPRSRNGCSSCRMRKLKCDERRPVCNRCIRLRLPCDWQWRPILRPDTTTNSRRGPPRPLQPRPPERPRNVLSATDDGGSAGQRIVYCPTPLAECRLRPPSILRNSIELSALDHECFMFFPHGLQAFVYGKAWNWSAYAYIYQEVTKHSPCVMHIIIAIAARELHLRSADNMSFFACADGNALRQTALSHYNQALLELSKLLSATISNSSPDLDAAFTAFFFMICYESQFGDGCGTIRTHLRGFLAFFKSACLLSRQEQNTPLIDRVTPLGHQLLLIIATYDLSLIGLDPGSGVIFKFLLEYRDLEGCLLDQLHSAAHHALPRLWGPSYPPDALLDDLENIKSLEMIHECQKLRFQLCSVSLASTEMDLSLVLMNARATLDNIKQKFQDLLLMARIAETTQTPPPRRAVRTILLAATEYYSVELFCHKVVCAQLLVCYDSGCHADSLANLFLMAQKALSIDKRLLSRIAWPLFLASAETTDPIHLDWIQKHFERAASEYGSLTGLEKRIPTSRSWFAALHG